MYTRSLRQAQHHDELSRSDSVQAVYEHYRHSVKMMYVFNRKTAARPRRLYSVYVAGYPWFYALEYSTTYYFRPNFYL